MNPLRRESGTALGRLAGLIALLGTVLAGGPGTAVLGQSVPAGEDGLPIERRPYRVDVRIAFQSDPELTEGYRQGVLGDMAEGIRRTVGRMWTAELEEDRRLLPAAADRLERMSSETVRRTFHEEGTDKVYLLLVRKRGQQYVVSGREWDAALRELGLPQSESTWERRAVGEAAVRLLVRLFRPVLVVDRVDRKEVRLRLRAGVFPARDPQAAQLRKGDFLQPFFRYRNDEGRVERIDIRPWSYLMVESLETGRVTCRLLSGFRSPLGTGHAYRMDRMAIRVRPVLDSTEVRLFPYDQPGRPLAGHLVRIVPKTLPEQEAQAEPLDRIADRDGRVRVPVLPDRSLVWLYVRSGNTTLVRAPFVPGVRRTVDFEVPDDSLRLAVEGEIDLLKGKLIDVVAQRTTLMARIRMAADGNEWDRVDELLAELEALPGPEMFESRLVSIRVPAVEKAQERGDRLAVLKIRRLCSDASELVQRYLDPEKLQEFRREIREQRRLAQETS